MNDTDAFLDVVILVMSSLLWVGVLFVWGTYLARRAVWELDERDRLEAEEKRRERTWDWDKAGDTLMDRFDDAWRDLANM